MQDVEVDIEADLNHLSSDDQAGLAGRASAVPRDDELFDAGTVNATKTRVEQDRGVLAVPLDHGRGERVKHVLSVCNAVGYYQHRTIVGQRSGNLGDARRIG
jgi:hypothetical protein